MQTLSDFLGIKKQDCPLVLKTYFLFFASGMFANAVGSILRYLHDSVYGYGFSPVFQGTLTSLNQVGNFCAIFIAGYLPFAIGRKNSSVILISTEVLGIILMVLTGNPYLLIVAFIFCGLGRGSVSNITNVIIGQYAENKSAGLNILHATFAVGAVISPILMASMGGKYWRIPVLIIGLMLVIATFFLQFSSLDNTRSTNKKEALAIPRSLNFWVNSFILLFYLSVEASLMSYLVSYLSFSGNLSDTFSNMSASIVWLMILIGRLTCASISSKANKGYLILTLSIGLFLSITLLLNSSSVVMIVLGLLGTGLSLSGIYPTTLSTNEKRFNSSTSATAICIGVSTVGAIVMQMAIGAVSSQYGYKVGLELLYIPLVLMLALVIFKAFFLKQPLETN